LVQNTSRVAGVGGRKFAGQKRIQGQLARKTGLSGNKNSEGKSGVCEWLLAKDCTEVASTYADQPCTFLMRPTVFIAGAELEPLKMKEPNQWFENKEKNQPFQ